MDITVLWKEKCISDVLKAYEFNLWIRIKINSTSKRPVLIPLLKSHNLIKIRDINRTKVQNFKPDLINLGQLPYYFFITSFYKKNFFTFIDNIKKL